MDRTVCPIKKVTQRRLRQKGSIASGMRLIIDADSMNKSALKHQDLNPEISIMSWGDLVRAALWLWLLSGFEESWRLYYCKDRCLNKISLFISSTAVSVFACVCVGGKARYAFVTVVGMKHQRNFGFLNKLTHLFMFCSKRNTRKENYSESQSWLSSRLEASSVFKTLQCHNKAQKSFGSYNIKGRSRFISPSPM